ncbi:uncharacterized protein At2g29880 [Raphanus sativus]|uniref:Uncharacterized protein At2g29880 n=1 Tax=Raphanus sativus TaxID=3726 RepID=A0A6J0LJI8_RAPSA|nr:uncharacterized protein At2g29880 [Raphanus sativus]
MEDSHRKEKEKGDYNSWNHDETRILVQLLVEAVNNNWRDSSASFSKLTVESKILPELNKDVFRAKDFKNYQSRHKYLKLQHQNCADLLRYSSGFGWDPLTKKITASNEVWNDYLKTHPKHKNLRSDTFEFFEDLQIIFGQGVATGKNAVGLGDGTDACTYKAGENSNEENWNDVANIYEFDASTRDHELSEQYTTFDSQTVPESRTEKFQPKKKARSERSVPQKDENPIMTVSTQILNIIQQREERQQKEASERKVNVWDALKEISDLEDRIRFKALTQIHHLGIQEFLLKCQWKKG